MPTRRMQPSSRRFAVARRSCPSLTRYGRCSASPWQHSNRPGEASGINYEDENTGLLPSKTEASGRSLGSYGEGVKVTPLQLALMVSALGNGGNADVQQQLQACSQGGDPADVESAAFPAAGVRLEAEIDPRKIPAANHAVPTDPDRVEQVDQLAPDVQDAGSLRSQQPFMAIGRQEIDRGSP